MSKIPTSEKAERLVLAACLLGGRDIAEAVLPQLVPEDFYSLANREAFGLLVRMADDHRPIDAVTFQLDWPKHISAPAAPPENIIAAQDDIPSAANHPEYVRELKEASLRRKTYEVGYKLAKDARNPRADIAECITGATVSLEGNESAQVESVSGATATNMLIADLERRHQHQGRLTGIATGFNGLDRLTDGFQPQELSIIGARPSQGKSALLIGFVINAALRDSVPTLVLSLEMSIPALLRRTTSAETCIPMRVLKDGGMLQRDFAKVASFNAKLKAAPIHWFDGTGGATFNRLAGLIRYHVNKFGVRLVVLDYLQKVRPNTRHEKRTYEVAEVSGGFKALAVRHSIHVCAAAQLNREPDTASKGPRAPRLSDLADSGQIERDADLVGLLHRQRTEDDPHGVHAHLYVAKQRDGELGVVDLRFNGELCRFEDGGP